MIFKALSSLIEQRLEVRSWESGLYSSLDGILNFGWQYICVHKNAVLKQFDNLTIQQFNLSRYSFRNQVLGQDICRHDP